MNLIEALIQNPDLAKNVKLEVSGKDLVLFVNSFIHKMESAQEKAPPQIPEEYLTREETANLLKVSFPTLWRWSRDGQLPAVKIGNHVRYKLSDIEKALTKID